MATIERRRPDATATTAAAVASLGPENDGEEEEEEEDWTTVTPKGGRPRGDGTLSEGSASNSNKPKAARKNERRRERRRRQRRRDPRLRQQQQQRPGQSAGQASSSGIGGDSDGEGEEGEDGGSEGGDGALARAVADSALARALADSSLADGDGGGGGGGGDPRYRRLRNLRKKISAAESLASRPPESLSPDQVAKLERLPSLSAEVMCLESDLRAEADAREAEERERREAEAERNRLRLAEWDALEGGRAVSGFSGGTDEHACPLCAGPIEAATSTVPCRHVFCRACLEEAVAGAADRSGGDPAACVCPMCRTCLYDVVTGSVRAEPAESVRRKMRKRRCVCSCGEEVALSALRRHLRECGEAAPGLFADDERKRFGHTFEQPWLDPEKCAAMRGEGRRKKKGGRRGPAPAAAQWSHFTPDGYDEDAEIQAAILLSLEE